jgi:membrane-bound ClpP family serine protease
VSMNRALIMSGLVGLGTLTILVGIYAERSHPGAVLAAPLLFGAGSVIVAACMGKRWALKICLFTLIVIGFMSFRSRDATDLSVDSSIIYRLAVWSAVFVIGLATLLASAGAGHLDAGRASDVQMLGVFSEFERAMIQERVKAGLARARAQGKRLGGPRVGQRSNLLSESPAPMVRASSVP